MAERSLTEVDGSGSSSLLMAVVRDGWCHILRA